MAFDYNSVKAANTRLLTCDCVFPLSNITTPNKRQALMNLNDLARHPA
jgi:hypothetical protein